MNAWPKRRLEDVADLCLGKMLDQKKNKGQLRPYLANINVRWGQIDVSDLREMRFEDRELDRYGLRMGDIVMCEGGEPGRCALWTDVVPGMMIQKALHRIRPKSCLDSRFLFYSLFHDGRSGGFDGYFTGATIKHMPGEQLAKVQVAVPPLDEQRRIASILGAYDELIEVNRQRVAVLEAMARGLFEEWFVRFCFPGHENHKIIDTPDGPLPEGWKWTNLGDALDNFDRLRKPISGQKRLSMQGPYPYYGAAKIFDYIDGFLFDGLYLLVAEDGSVITPEGFPMLQLVDGQFWVNNHAHVVRGKAPFTTELIYLALERFPISGYITGAAQPKITQGNLNRIRVREADKETMQRFGTIVADQFALILALKGTNEKLAKSRDLLLPRLISGELSVAAAEAQLEHAA